LKKNNPPGGLNRGFTVNYFEVYPEIATLPKVNMKAEISEFQPGIIFFVMNIAIATGF